MDIIGYTINSLFRIGQPAQATEYAYQSHITNGHIPSRQMTQIDKSIITKWWRAQLDTIPIDVR